MNNGISVSAPCMYVCNVYPPLVVLFFCITGEYTAQYLIHIWILTILSLAPFIKFYYLYKAILLLTMFLIYSILISQLMPSWTMGM